ncbi:hypothetical protein KKF81_02485 [Candidatus Micrarchaeota archaeon]|nr:hypothetical protein [Candidatus Micrarchaeota archaeon]MBU1165788.1 hypothetical protein [Candidatus Micrarchaeota archaeon]MBU1886296.1 hypothetical protein [Candidatus Micrarchaeota archaeon]
MDATYETLDKVWKITCKTLLGDEIGELKQYDKWLSEYVEPVKQKKSTVSGKNVYFAVPYYCEDGKFVSLDEIDFNKRFSPLDINEIKDIDSIADAFRERFQYCGNVVLGNSKNIGESSNIQNSHYVYKSDYVYGCEYVAYSSHVKNCKYVFTTNSDCGSDFLIRCLEGFNGHRSFETWTCFNCSDCYCSFGARGSQNVMFSFNTDTKSFVIGNLELGKDKFLQIKNKLVEQIRDELEDKKYLPSVIDMATEPGKKARIELDFENCDEKKNLETIENVFRKTSKTILGKELTDLDRYDRWLTKHIPPVQKAKSCVSNSTLFKSSNYPLSVLPGDRLVKEHEARKIATITKLDETDLESFESIKSSLWKIAFFISEFRLGENNNVFESALSNSSVNCCRGCVYNDSKNSAYCFWPRNSEYMFGSQLTVESSLGIKCYNSLKLSRGFEVDSCSNCSDIYYSHNCENVQDSMFCFNVKNMRHGIGNAVYALDKYKQTKTAILEQIINELEDKKDLKWDIFNIGCE